MDSKTLSARHRHQGSILLFVIACLIVLSAIAAAVTTLTSSAAITNLANPSEQCAYYLALSGLHYWKNGRTGTFSVGEGSFTLSQTGPDKSGYYTVQSLGRTQSGSGLEANILLTARKPGAAPITFENDIADFTRPTQGKTATDPYAILIFDKDLPQAPDGIAEDKWLLLWSENAGRYGSGWMQLGGGRANASGAVWYNGSHGDAAGAPQQEGTCRGGSCRLGKGLRAYFVFSLSQCDTSEMSTDCGDGFTFTVATAANDPQTAAGGPPAGVGNRGEYLGYAGPGPAGVGIRPPKLAVEVDLYPNKTRNNPQKANTRADYSNANHVAVVYWGAAETEYDDNVHGAGQNPPGASSGYSQHGKTPGGFNWLEDGEPHALRVELHRQDAPGGGSYQVRVWVDPDAPGNDDVTADFTAQTPQIDHTATLSADDHAGLSAIRFGWTEGTGKETQTVALRDFSLDFRR